jgi:EAL domain-containing protein (putative c-di-GMP-specific phosphodiesterase class I)/GGDEF domain-containing protein
MTLVLWLAVLSCFVAAVGLHLWTLRDALRRWSAHTAAEHGRRLAVALEQAGTSPPRRDAALQAYFDENRLEWLELIGARGESLFRRRAPDAEAEAQNVVEKWLLPRGAVVETPLPARLAAAGQRLQLEPSAVTALDDAWNETLRFAAALGAGLAAVLAFALLGLRGMRWRVAELARASTARSEPPGTTIVPAATAPPPEAPAPSDQRLRKLARLEGLVVAQAHELDLLRRRAHVDALTGLPSRSHTMTRLEQALEGETSLPAAGLLLLRVRELAAVNRRVGYEVGSVVLQSVAQAVQGQAECSPDAIGGRLNGSDFALLLPFPHVARSTAEALLTKLRHTLHDLDPVTGVAIGAVEISGRIEVARAMALADEALAGAESGTPFAVCEVEHSPELVAFGDSVWQQRLIGALKHRRTVLGAYPVCDRRGRLLYLDCPMRVQFDEGGDYEPAWRWLAPATRGRLGPDIDLRVLQMAVDAIGADGQARCVNVSLQSLASNDFMVEATELLQSLPAAAAQLWVDVPEAVAVERRALLADAAQRWRPLGVRLALEHAGEALGRIEALDELGLECVRIDSRFVRGLTGADSADMRRFLQALVRRVHDAGLKIAAEGVALAGDLAVVWTLGFDAATGPAVLKRGHSMSPQ